MPVNKISDASRMLVFLKKEEAFYKSLLSQMEQESVRLKVESLALKAAIRQEEINAYREKDWKNLKRRHTKKVERSDLVPSILEKDIPSVSSQTETTTDCDDFSLGDVLSPASNSVSSIGNELPEIETAISNITDDRYYEPLCLNITKDDNLVEFDD